MVEARVHMIIHGDVQGVFFRQSTKKEADGLGLTGRVRNRRDGTVEVVAEGDKTALENLVAWCHEGPPRSRVTNVDIEWGGHKGEFDRFEVAATL